MVATALGILSVLMSPGFHSAHIRRLEEGFKSLKLTKTETIKLDLRVISWNKADKKNEMSLYF